MMIVFSHRYSKGDKFILESEACASSQMMAPIDFTIIRDTMYKYSKKAQDRYFSFPIESFLFAAFSLSDEGQGFLQNKPDNQNDPAKLNRLLTDLGALKDQGIQTLRGQRWLYEQTMASGAANNTELLAAQCY